MHAFLWMLLNGTLDGTPTSMRQFREFKDLLDLPNGAIVKVRYQEGLSTLSGVLKEHLYCNGTTGLFKKPILLLDMDGVLTDFEEGFLRAWRQAYPEAPYIAKSARRTPKIEDDYDPKYRDAINAIFQRQGFYKNLPVMAGAENILQELQDSGHEVQICTRPLRAYEHCVPEKYELIEKHYGRKWTERLIVTRDKTLVKGDFLIDDMPEITGVCDPTWTQILFAAPYNKAAGERKPRVDWSNWKDLLSWLKPATPL